MVSPNRIPARSSERELRYLDVLLRTGEILSSTLDWQETIQGVCRAIVETIADACFLNLKDENGNIELAAAAHRDPSLSGEMLSAGQFLRAPVQRGVHPVVHVIRTGEPICAPEIDDAYLTQYTINDEHEQYIRRMQYRSIMVIPLRSSTQGTIGTLSLMRTGDDRDDYDDETLRFAQDLGRRCATAIVKARLYEQNVHIARVFQQAALPETLPVREGITFDAFYEPSSESLLVGGDWYDAFELGDGRIAITVGDVLGHGIRAAVWMSRLRNGLRAALFSQPDPVHALEVADKLLRTEFREEFTTAVAAIFDPEHSTLSCASAGHPGPLVWDGGGHVSDPFTHRGLPLGMRNFQPDTMAAQTITLQTGGFVAFFTDGLLERNRNVDEAWSALQSAILRQHVREAAHPAEAIRFSVIAGQRHDDDLAILTLRLDHARKRLE